MLIFDTKVHKLFDLRNKFVSFLNNYHLYYRLFTKKCVTLQTYEKKYRNIHRL